LQGVVVVGTGHSRGSNKNQDVGNLQSRSTHKRRNLHGSSCSGTIGIVVKVACAAVVEQEIVGILRLGNAGSCQEICRSQFQACQAGKHAALEFQFVEARGEIGDQV